MGRLGLRVPLGERETATSFCARLAIRNGCSSVREFCLDMGLRFQDVVNGTEKALARLAMLADVDVAALKSAAYRKIGTTLYCANEIIFPHHVRRNWTRVCPACVAQDRARWGHLGAAAPYGRSAWLLSPVRTCVHHGLELVEVFKDNQLRLVEEARQHDFVLLFPSIDQHLDSWLETAPRRLPCPFELHVDSRLRRAPASAGPLLDALPLHALFRTCEMVGAVEVNGPAFRLSEMTEHAWQEAREAGFEVLAGGVPSVMELLGRLRENAVAIKHNGPRALYGQLYLWLQDSMWEPAFDPLRELLREATLNSVPFGPGDSIFREPVLQRRVHSVYSLSREIGAHPKRLKKLLHVGGLIRDSDLGRTDDFIVFPADAALERVLALQESLSAKEAAAHIDAPRTQFQRLVSDGYIVPRIASGGTFKDACFDKRDLDAFVARLLANTPELSPQDKGFVDLVDARRQCHKPFTVLLDLVLNGTLKRVCRAKGKHGFLSALVDPEEICELLYPRDESLLTIAEASRRLRCKTSALAALIELRELEGIPMPNPITRLEQMCIPTASAENFARKFVSLAELRHSNAQATRRKLETADVKPAFDYQRVGVYFYRRAEIAPALADQSDSKIPELRNNFRQLSSGAAGRQPTKAITQKAIE